MQPKPLSQDEAKAVITKVMEHLWGTLSLTKKIQLGMLMWHLYCKSRVVVVQWKDPPCGDFKSIGEAYSVIVQAMVSLGSPPNEEYRKKLVELVGALYSSEYVLVSL